MNADVLAIEDELTLVAKYLAGMTRRELADRYGISDASARRLLRRHDVRRSDPGRAD